MKKILAVILLFTCMLTPSITATYAADEPNSILQNKTDFLAMLDIYDESFSDDAMISRGEFTYMLIRSMNCDTIQNVQTPFSDVPSTAVYASAVSLAHEMGIVAGNGSGLFYPDEAIAGYDAVKMAVQVLGYAELVSAYGGYPNGYLRVAKETGLTDGCNVCKAEGLSVEETIVFFYNFLTSPLYRLSAVVKDGLSYSKDKQETVLTTYFNLAKCEGVVKTAGFATMIPDRDCQISQITINGMDYQTDLTELDEYLGKTVEAWYEIGEKNIKAIYVKPVNQIYTLSAGNGVRLEKSRKLAVENDAGRTVHYTLDPSFTFVRNGRAILHTEFDFLFEVGEFSLIDNDNDGMIEVVLAWQAEYMVVSSVNLQNGVIYDNSQNGMSVIAKHGDGYYYSIVDVDADDNRLPMSLEKVKNQTVLTVFRSTDGKYLRALASTMKVRGIVTAYDDKELIIDGAAYEFNSYFTSNYNFEVGSEYTFSLAADRKITAISSSAKGRMQYGYVLNYGTEKSGLAAHAKIMLLTAKNEKQTLELTEKVVLDGIKMSSTDTRLEGCFLHEGAPKYQVIRYALNQKGLISTIDTAVELADGVSPDEALGTLNYSDDSLTKFLKTKQTRWYSWYNIFSPNTLLGSSTVIFSVPYDLKNGNGVKMNEEDFSAISKSELSSYGPYTIDTYDVDEFLQPSVIVVYNPNSGGSLSVSENNTPCIVESVRDTIDRNGDVTKLLVYYEKGHYYQYALTADLYKERMSAGTLPKSGDIVRVVVNQFGEIAGLAIDAEYNDTTKSPVFTGNAPKNRRFDISQYAGKCYAHSDTRLTLQVDDTSNPNADSTYPIVSGVAAFTINQSELDVAVYNTRTHTVKHGSLDLLADVRAVGKDNASSIFFGCYSHMIQQLYIYE